MKKDSPNFTAPIYSRHTRLMPLVILWFIFIIPSILCSEENIKQAKADEVSPKSFWQIQFENVKKELVYLSCEVAQTSKEKARGLMFQKSLANSNGMIFIYKKPQIMYFWMRNTSIPLSIAFVNEKNIITGIHSMKPYDERIISSHTKSFYAIEANRGWFKKNFIFARSKIKIFQDLPVCSSADSKKNDPKTCVAIEKSNM